MEALAEFEKASIENNEMISSLVRQLFPKADMENIANFIYAAFTLAFGLYPMCKLSDLQIEAIKLSGSIYTPPDFKKTYLASLYQLMYCLEHSIQIK